MRRQALCALLLLSGCDDPDVEGRALDILQFGGMIAKVQCADVPYPAGGMSDCDPIGGVTYTGHRFADGSAFVTLSGNPVFWGRSEAEAEEMEFLFVGAITPVTFAVAGGELTVSRAACTPVVVDLELSCTGFNLEAFGVAP
jgi:hypothetical protein